MADSGKKAGKNGDEQKRAQQSISALSHPELLAQHPFHKASSRAKKPWRDAKRKKDTERRRKRNKAAKLSRRKQRR